MGVRPRTGPASAALAGAALVALAGPGPARAGKHDLALLNLCEPHTPAAGVLNAQVAECRWVERGPNGLIAGVAVDGDAEVRFRSLMSELGAVMAPRLVVPADTLGFAGFQIAAELGTTRISNGAAFWNGVEGVAPQNPGAARPNAWLTTVGATVRKGVWLGLPAFEVGGGAMHLLDSRLVSWQGYAKLALHEGFHRWPVPSVALRAAASYLTGTDQVRMTVTSFDLVVSKAIGVRGTFRFEPFGGLSTLFIHARSGVLDATPSCDAHEVARAAPGGPPLGGFCAEAQRGTRNDFAANFRFPDQSVITRQRWFAGAKFKLAVLFLTAQYEQVRPGSSRDSRRPNGAKDEAAAQTTLSLSGGFDF